MGFSYKPLLKLLVDRNMKKTDLHTELGLSSATLAKLSKGMPISGESVEKICVYFRCQPGDIIEITWPEAETAEAPLKKERQKRASPSKTLRRRSGSDSAKRRS